MYKLVLKIKILLRYLRALAPSIYFDFRYLPFKQAVKLPILLYKPHFYVCSGKIEIKDKNLGFGSILLGFPCSSLYPNNGISIKLRGQIIFHGKASIPNASSIEVGEYGKLEFGSNFIATAQLKIGCHNHIRIGDGVLVSWDNIICDTDYHSLIIDDKKTTGYAPIVIGDYSWFGMRCTTLKGSVVGPFSVVASNSMINSDLSNGGGKCLIAGCPAKIIKYNVYRDPLNDKINYQ